MEKPVNVVTYSYARQNLAQLMDEVEDDAAPVVISRQRNRGAAVLVSQREWNSMQETLYLLGTPTNAERLRKGIAELNAGRGVEYEPGTPLSTARRAIKGARSKKKPRSKAR